MKRLKTLLFAKDRIAFDLVSLILAIFTIIMVAWYQIGMNNKLVITPDNAFRVWEEVDEENGGNSVASVTKNDVFALRCIINENPTFEYPYCNFFFALSNNDSGIDLTQFDTVTLDFKHQTSAPDNLRVYLNHFYTEKNSARYPFKLNLHSIETTGSWQSITLDLRNFDVPAWWVCQSDAENPETEITNVKHFLIATGISTEGRVIEVDVKKIEFKGKWFSEEDLYQWLLTMWLTWIVSLLIFRMFQLSKTSMRLRRRSRALEEDNKNLNLQSKELAYKATHDELTGLFNRSGLKSHIEESLERLIENNTPFCVLIIDLDDFKLINDQLGHDKGDEVLIKFSKLLETRCRQSDIPGRWGGEEFIVICKDSNSRGAARLAQDLVDATGHANLLTERKVTCSIGLAQADNDDLEQILKSADEALYQAKRQGKNRVVIYQ